MSAVIETPQEGARRLFSSKIKAGFTPAGLWQYSTSDGAPLFSRVRLNPPAGSTDPKIIRPIRLDGVRYVIGEPDLPNGKPLLNLPAIVERVDVTVWIVEGEKCADALTKLGLLATTSGSASSANAADWEPLRGRRCIIWPDNDTAGQRYGADVASILTKLGCAVEIVNVATLNLPEAGDVANWLAMNPDALAADVEGLARVDRVEIVEQSSMATPHARPAPEPLRRPIPPAEPYPLAELGDVLRPAAEAIKRVIQAPDAIIGGSLLAAASLAVQAQANVVIDGRVLPLSLWLLSVAESGERKSAVDKEAMRAAREFERELGREYDAATAQHAAQMAEWKARCESATSEAKKTKGQGLAGKLEEIGTAPLAPLIPRVIVADFTAEGMFKLLDAGFPSIGAFTDEAAQVFGGHGMTKETVQRTAGAMCKLWDCGELDRVRAGDGAQKLYGRRVALHLMAQPVIAEAALSNEVLAGQGFLARCLLAWPEGTAGSRSYKAENLHKDTDVQRFANAMLELHRRPMPVNEEGQRQELEPRPLRLSTDAFNLWRDVHDMIEKASGKGGQYAQVRPFASKAAEQALRIAGVLTLTESPTAQTIEADVIERAAELTLWHLNEAVRLAGTAQLSPVIRDAEALLEWAHATGRRFVCSSEALQFGPSRIRDRERFGEAMAMLERAAWAAAVAVGMEIGGKHRRNVWGIVPANEAG